MVCCWAACCFLRTSELMPHSAAGSDAAPELTMTSRPKAYDAVIVGSGPNGLSAAVVMAQAGLKVIVLEGKETIGGGTRTEELTLPGFRHDVCSAIHPTALLSPLLRKLPLEAHGLQWDYARYALAHPLDNGTAAVLQQSLEATASSLGVDGNAYQKLMRPLLRESETLVPQILRSMGLPEHPLVMSQFAWSALRSATSLARSHFKGEKAAALFAGCAAHSVLPLDKAGTASFGLVLALAGHAVGWPCARGGSIAISNALASLLRSLGGEIETSRMVESLGDLPPHRVAMMDITPRQLLRIAPEALSPRYRRKLEQFRYAPGVFKIDWALDGPIPWTAAECADASTVHVGGTLNEVAESEHAAWNGKHSEKPFVLLAQQSMFDSTRAPEGKHTGWAYCHVPHNSTVDMTNVIEQQIERFAPGFRDRILARHTINTAQYEQHNPNVIGGDIGGGANNLRQFFARPVMKWNRYATSNPSIYLCSSSTPPGGGVHGMCGYWAADAALRRNFGKRALDLGEI